jgi:hypothetical protein
MKRILCNELLFKTKLDIPVEKYNWLKEEKNLEAIKNRIISDYQPIVIFEFPIFPLSLPFVMKLMTKYIAWCERKRLRKELDLTKEFRTPLDFLASGVLEILILVIVKIFVPNGRVDTNSLKVIVNNLTYQWGYCKEVVEISLEQVLSKPRLQNFKYDNAKMLVDSIAKLIDGLDREKMLQVILLEVKELVFVDGNADKKRVREYNKLKVAFEC